MSPTMSWRCACIARCPGPDNAARSPNDLTAAVASRPHLGEWRSLRQADYPVDDNTLDRARDLRLIGGSGPCSKDRVEQRVEHLRQTELLSIERVLRDDAGRAGGV